MKVSKKSDYALRALMTLVGYYNQRPVSIRELAELNGISRKFLEHIMLDLKSIGVVRSVSGRIGGFELAKPPEEITMGEIVRRFDGLIAPISCVSSNQYECCSQEASCQFRRVMLEIRNYTSRIMDEANLARVHQLTPVDEIEVFDAAFIEGAGI